MERHHRHGHSKTHYVIMVHPPSRACVCLLLNPGSTLMLVCLPQTTNPQTSQPTVCNI